MNDSVDLAFWDDLWPNEFIEPIQTDNEPPLCSEEINVIEKEEEKVEPVPTDLETYLNIISFKFNGIIEELEYHSYLYNTAVKRAQYIQLASECSEDKDLVDITPAYQFPSIFHDISGHSPSFTTEALEKFEASIGFPIFRKKYDWNISLWAESDKQKLDESVKQKVDLDVIKLQTAHDLRTGLIDEASIAKTLLEKRLNLDESTKLTIDHLETLENLLEIQERSISEGHPVNPKLAVVKDYDCKKNFKITYWTQFWNVIASIINTRFDWSGRDCLIRFTHHQSPKLNLTDFSVQEDAELKKLSLKYKERKWHLMASELNTRRTEYQCFERYQRALNEELVKRDWDPQEDDLLNRLVEEMGIENMGEPLCWSRIAAQIPGRSSVQCRIRYNFSLKKNIKIGGWSLLEDFFLHLLVESYGRREWAQIQQHIPWRTTMKSRERYEKALRIAKKVCIVFNEEEKQSLHTIKPFIDYYEPYWKLMPKVFPHIIHTFEDSKEYLDGEYSVQMSSLNKRRKRGRPSKNTPSENLLKKIQKNYRKCKN